MRIIAGRFKGRRLLPVPGDRVRSTADRVKESLFNILMHDVPNAVALDLFCGAGALGLEAISRGAESVVFVDSSPKSLKRTLDNARTIGADDKVVTIRSDAMSALRSPAKRERVFTLILADPPYGEGWPAKTLRAVADSSCRAAEGVLVIEHHKKDEPGETPVGFSLWTTRRFGDTVLTFWRWGQPPAPADEQGS
jgi:16S rRNA (guanine(966)-N(2))-methyltransferase RsmD